MLDKEHIPLALCGPNSPVDWEGFDKEKRDLEHQIKTSLPDSEPRLSTDSSPE